MPNVNSVCIHINKKNNTDMNKRLWSGPMCDADFPFKIGHFYV